MNEELDYFNQVVEEERLKKNVTPSEPIGDPAAPKGEPLASVEIDPEAQAELDNAKDEDGFIMAIGKGLFNGTVRAGQSLSQLMASGINKLTGTEFKAPEPVLPDNDTAIGRLTEAGTQFGLHYYMGGGALKAAGWLNSGKKLNDIGRAFTQGAIADFTAFKGDEERLSNFLTEFDNPIMNNAVTQYLAADKDDGEFEGRMKNVLEGGGIGIFAEVITTAVKGLKKSKTLLGEGDRQAAKEVLEASRHRVGELLEASREQLGAMVNKIKPDAVVIEPPPVSMGKPINELVNINEADASNLKISLAGKDWTNPDSWKDLDGKLAGKIRTDQFETAADVNAFAETFADLQMPTFDKWPHDEQIKVAKAYGMPIDQVRQYYKLGAVNNQVLVASRTLLSEQGQKVSQMIKSGATDEELAVEMTQYGEYLNMFSSFSNISGRTLDAHRIRGMEPGARKELMQEVINGRYGGPDGFKKFKDAWSATDGDLGEITGLMKMSKWRIAQDSALELWKNGILSGLKTFNTNLLGATNSFFQIPIRLMEGAASNIRTAGKAGEEQIYMGEALAMVAADLNAGMEALNVAWRSGKQVMSGQMPKIDVPHSLRDKAELGITRKISADYWGIGTKPGALARFISSMTGDVVTQQGAQDFMRGTVDKAGAVINTPGNLLNIQDGFVQSLAKRQQRYALAYRQAAREGTDPKKMGQRVSELLMDESFIKGSEEDVNQFAKRVTFQENMGPFGRQLDQMVRTVRPLGIPVLEYIMPFRRTPYNIFKQGVIETNPLFGAPQAYRAMRDNTMSGIEKDKVMGRYAFGTMVSASAAAFVVDGNITGAGPSDPALKAALARTGWKPYSIRVQNGEDNNGNPRYKYYQYNKLEPVAFIVGSIATAIETSHYNSTINDEKDKTFASYAAAVNSALMESTLDKSFFTGVSDFFSAMNDPQRYLPTWMNKFGSSFVPAISRDIETMLQDKVYLRDVREFENAINAKMIGKSGNVPVARNRWGDPISVDPGWFLGGRSYFSPIAMSEGYAEDIDREIVRLAVDGVKVGDGSTKVFKDALISMPDRVIMKHGVSIRLDSEQYSRLLEIAGKDIKLPKFPDQKPMSMRDALNYLVTETEMYKEAGPFPASQAKLIKMVSQDYDRLAQDQLVTEFPDLKAKVEKAKSLAIQSQFGLVPEETRMKLMELYGDAPY